MTTVESCDLAKIRDAIREVSDTKGLSTEAGRNAFDRLLKAPGHTLLYSELVKKFGTPNLHLGWFCRRVAEKLGIPEPPKYALLKEDRINGKLHLTVKDRVVEALTT